MSRASRILEKVGAGKKSAPYQQTRKGRRPIRVHNLLKKASLPGQDMRNPGSTPGQQKSPTKDSTQFAQKLLNTSSAEVGPMPGKRKMSMENHMMEKDPLIRHLKKQAEALENSHGLLPAESANLKLPAPSKSGGNGDALENNEDGMPVGEPAVELASESPKPTAEMEGNGQDWKGYTEKLFDGKVTKKKSTDKDYDPAVKSVVDKVLGQ